MGAAKRDDNREPSQVLNNTLGTNVVIQTGVALTDSTPAHVAVVDGNGDQITAFASSLNLKNWDYMSLALTNSTTETYTFKTGGSGGTTTNTLVVVYTDSTKANLSSVTKT